MDRNCSVSDSMRDCVYVRACVRLGVQVPFGIEDATQRDGNHALGLSVALLQGQRPAG